MEYKPTDVMSKTIPLSHDWENNLPSSWRYLDHNDSKEIYEDEARNGDARSEVLLRNE